MLAKPLLCGKSLVPESYVYQICIVCDVIVDMGEVSSSHTLLDQSISISLASEWKGWQERDGIE